MNDKKIYKSFTPNPDKITPTPYSINETQLKNSGSLSKTTNQITGKNEDRTKTECGLNFLRLNLQQFLLLSKGIPINTQAN